TLDLIPQIVIAALFSVAVGFIAFRGVSGSTTVALMINIIQLATLAVFAVIAIIYRTANPDHTTFVFSGPGDVMLPHNLMNVLLQGTIAILILVGFESCTAFGAEAKNAKRDVPRAVILALVTQGLFAYLIEYFAANFAISDKLTYTSAHGTALTGLAAPAASCAPTGGMVRGLA